MCLLLSCLQIMALPSKLFKFNFHGGLLCQGARHITRHIHWPSIGCGQTGSLCGAPEKHYRRAREHVDWCSCSWQETGPWNEQRRCYTCTLSVSKERHTECGAVRWSTLTIESIRCTNAKCL